MKEVIQYFWRGASSVYVCFVDASKAFDKVHFDKLFTLLLERRVPGQFLRLLHDSYVRQNVTAAWNGSVSQPFPVTNGVRQGAVASATLFTMYLDVLLEKLEESAASCIKPYYPLV